MPHEITRIRHEARRRRLIVSRTSRVTPNMLRLHLVGPDLDGFASPAFDDHIKVFVPGEDGAVEGRHYTPRRHDVEAGELAIDFAVHEAGPVTRWALGARPGDAAEIGGPRGSTVVPDDFDWWLMIGDETALPAIGRRLEDLPAGTPVITIVAVAGPEEEQRFETAARHRDVWVHRPLAQANDPQPFLAALAGLPRGAGPCRGPRPPGRVAQDQRLLEEGRRRRPRQGRRLGSERRFPQLRGGRRASATVRARPPSEGRAGSAAFPS
jgi:NADPH-dependent ferric siderophore reductase